MTPKKKWILIGTAVAVVLVIIITCTAIIVGALNRNREQQADIAHKAFGYSTSPSTSAGDGGKGDEDDSYTHVPNSVTAAANGVVKNILDGWTKTDDHVEKPDAKGLQSLMTPACAESYHWLWDDVFAKAHYAGLERPTVFVDATSAVQSVTGTKPNRTYVMTVTGTYTPWYWDVNNQPVYFDQQSSVWTVTVDEASSKVTKIINPTPDQLGFRIPDNLVNEQQPR